ncbi:hypothetical protein D7M15_08935 [Streptomyces sp. Z26]|nr:hypothetical protein D7M15_08935 [Streptomyces sp. Z26]
MKTQQPLSQIDPAWQPSEHHLAAAHADIDRLGPDATSAATAKFVRHHSAKGTAAADFGPLWITWLAREHAALPTPSGVVVHLPTAPRTGGTSTATERAAAAYDLSARLAAEEN